MSENTQLATAPVSPGFHKATTALSATLGIEPRMMVETLKKQCFPNMRAEDVTDAQLAAFISVANTLELNPLIPGMLYGYPSRNGGIVPLSGPDAILKKLDENIEKQKLEGYECTVYPEAPDTKPTHAVAKIWRKGSERPATFTAVFAEWVVNANPNWAQRPRHMLWLRAIKQCARQVIHGVPLDRDDMEIQDMQNVTPEPPPAPERPAAPTRSRKGAAAIIENTPPQQSAPVNKANVIEGNVVDGEFTEPSKAAPAAEVKPQSEAPTAPPQRTAAEQKILDDLKAKQEAGIKAKAEAAQKAQQQPEQPTKNAEGTAPKSLGDGETISATCEVVEVSPLVALFKGAPTACVQAVLKGEFNGDVLHVGGGTGTDEKNGRLIRLG